MDIETNNNNQKNNLSVPQVFSTRKDYYWKALSIYLIILSAFLLIKESISNSKIIHAVYHPIIIILLLFIVITFGSLIYQKWFKQELILSIDKIIFSNRERTRAIPWEKVLKISLIRNPFNKNRTTRLIKLKISKYRSIRINPSIYNNERELLRTFYQIKTILKK